MIVASVTKNLDLAKAPGNVVCRARRSGLSQTSVINVSQLTSLDRRFLLKRIGSIPGSLLEEVDNGIRLVLGL